MVRLVEYSTTDLVIQKAEDNNMTDEEILKDRASSYGSPQKSFKSIAELWSTYLDYPIKPHEVAVMMTLLKISRTTTARGESLTDSFADGRNYLTLAEELNEQ